MSQSSQSGEGLPVVQVGARVVDVDDNDGRVISTAEGVALIAIESGPQLAVPMAMLSAAEGGAYRVPFSFGGLRLPVLEEQLHASKRTVDAGSGVRIEKRVVSRVEHVDPALWRERLEVERVPVGTWVSPDALPPTRIEGDTLILPLLEEVLVVKKQIRLAEEVRITRRRESTRAPQDVSLEREEVVVTRFDEGAKETDS